MNARVLSHYVVAALFGLLLVSPTGARQGPAFAGGPRVQVERPPFTGNWTGSWTGLTPGGPQQGTVTITVDDEGNITGESLNKTVNQVAPIKGSVNKDGKATIEFEFPGQHHTAFGTISKTAKGSVIGTMVQKQGNSLVGTIDFELKKEKSRFAGTWSGSWTGLTQGGAQDGVVTMIVDDEGNVTGESLNKTIGQTTTLKGSVSNDGRSFIAFEFPGQSYTARGTCTKTSKGTVTGTATQMHGSNFFGTLEWEVKPVTK
jgi:hypothetical protein